MRFFLQLSLISFLSLFLAQMANAGMSLSQAIVHFEDGKRRTADVDVLNQGDETLYIRVTPFQVLKPGTEDESRIAYRNPKAAGLLVSPQRLVIAPGSRKRIRLVRLDDPTKKNSRDTNSGGAADKVFRVLVKPEVGELKTERTAVKILVAYEILVLAQPENPQINLVGELQGQQLHIRNTGNTNALLLEGFQCPGGQSREDEGNQCVTLNGKRIYAGNEWKIDVPYKTPVTYQVSKGLENTSVTFELASNKIQ